MRRFHSDHEGVLPDASVLALWNMGGASLAFERVSSYSATGASPTTDLYKLFSFGSTQFANGLYSGASGAAKITGGSGGQAGWYAQVAASSAQLYCATDWSVGMWYKAGDSVSTMSLMEYCSTTSSVLAVNLSPLGIHRLANGAIRLQWDVSTSSVGHFVDIPAAANDTDGHHLFVTKESSPATAALAKVSVWLDDQLRGSTWTLKPVASGTNYRDGSWHIGASRRWGLSTSTPTLVATGTTFDDVVFYTRPLGEPAARNLYRSGLQPWHDRRLYDAKTQKVSSRVLVENSDHEMVDLSTLYGHNWVQSSDVKLDVEQPVDRASIKLNRFRGASLNLSPLSRNSQLNFDSGGQFNALLDLRRKIQIDAAVMPSEWAVQGWEWQTVFSGYIDAIGWESESVSIECVDKMAPLMDTFQLDPIVHDYYASETLAETHLQTIINENVPRININGATTTFGYLGGTPVLYTPASSGWVLRYDDTPSGQVDGLLQSVADQIGWDCRWKWYDPWQDYRLTFYAPPRAMTLDIARLEERNVGGLAVVDITFTTDHGLTEEQLVTISGTVEYNGGGLLSVGEVLAYNKIRIFKEFGAGPVETVGQVTFYPVYTLTDSHVTKYTELKKDVSKIRNASVVKYGRDGSPITLTLSLVSGGGGSNITVVTPASAAMLMSQMVLGEQFTVSDCSDADGNGTYSIATIAGNIIDGAENVTAVVSSSSGIFTSDFIRFRQEFSCNTVSINRYGYRAAAVYEASNGNIDTANEAKKLADYIVGDLAEPTADISATIRCAPWFELHDLVKLAADKRQRWTEDLTTAIVAMQHHFEGAQSYTELALRSSAPTMGTVWVDRIRIDPPHGRPGLPVRSPTETDTASTDPRVRNHRGHSFVFGKRSRTHKSRGRGGKRRLRDDVTEIHLSTTSSNFVPSVASTLVAELRGNHIQIHHDADGAPLTPGQTYHMKYRERDIYGNLTLPSPTTSAVIRFGDRPASAKVYYNGTSSMFHDACWSPFPFTNDSTSPAFDNYNNFTVAPAASTVPLCQSPATGAYWQMPCDGTLEVEARLGFRNDLDNKDNVKVAIAIMRLGSSLPGSNASRPLHMKMTGPTEFTPTWSTMSTILVGSACSPSVFMSLNGRVSAHSGDYIQIGVFPNYIYVAGDGGAVPGPGTNMSGIHPVNAANNSSVSASWAKFTVISQD